MFKVQMIGSYIDIPRKMTKKSTEDLGTDKGVTVSLKIE